MTFDRRELRLPLSRILLTCSGLALLSACSEPLDFDLRGNFGNAMSTSEAARSATAPRPAPDDRGIISYPHYQVAVARRGDTLADVARRIGTDPTELARYNGIQTGDMLREGEIVALPGRVAEPSPATGAIATGPILPPEQVDISQIAGSAINRAGDQRVATSALPSTAPQQLVGREPVRHRVERGETAFTISRLYGVTVRSLAEWNGLDSNFAIREGQYLLIPVAAEAPPASTAAVPAPGTGSPTPTPPSATKPLPDEKTVPPVKAAAANAAPDLGKTQTKATASSARMSMPASGKIIREYTKGKNDGIDISAASGTPIVAADGGTVAAITTDADQVTIIVVKHQGDLLTVYANVDGIKVKKGDKVSRGQQIAAIRSGASNYVHFEVRKGFDSVDPLPYVQ